jgi:uncharacterized membrane protein
MDLHKLVHLFHVLVVGILFLFVGINREKTNQYLLRFLLYLGILIIVYHLYKMYNYLNNGRSYWVNLIHILFVGPLLIYIGYYGEKTSRKFFELLMMLAFASIGYHLYYLFV